MKTGDGGQRRERRLFGGSSPEAQLQLNRDGGYWVGGYKWHFGWMYDTKIQAKKIPSKGSIVAGGGWVLGSGYTNGLVFNTKI